MEEWEQDSIGALDDGPHPINPRRLRVLIQSEGGLLSPGTGDNTRASKVK
jgi:hypothetical protein